MSSERAFLQALVARPDDDTSRLVYADWLEERGDERAEYLRLECRLKSLQADDERRGPLEATLKELLLRLPADWLVWVRWPAYSHSKATLPEVAHHLVPLNGHQMRLPRGMPWAAFSHDGRFIYTCGADPHIWVWDGTTYELHARIRTELEYLSGPALHPTREVIAAGGQDGPVHVWDVPVGTEALCAKRHPHPVAAVCFVDEGRLLASGSVDGTARLTDARSGKRVGRLKRLGANIFRLSAPRTGLMVGAVHRQGVRVWDAELKDLFRFDGVYYHGVELQSGLAFWGESVWVTLWGRQPYLRIWSLAGPTPAPLPAPPLPVGGAWHCFQ